MGRRRFAGDGENLAAMARPALGHPAAGIHDGKSVRLDRLLRDRSVLRLACNFLCRWVARAAGLVYSSKGEGIRSLGAHAPEGLERTLGFDSVEPESVRLSGLVPHMHGFLWPRHPGHVSDVPEDAARIFRAGRCR